MTEIKVENLSQYIGNRIKFYRVKRKMTQEELANRLGTKKATISNYETGYRSPQQDMLFELARVLEISINDLFPATQKSKENNFIETIYKKLEPPRKEKVYNYAEKQLHEQETINNKVIPLVGKSAANPAVLEYGDIDIEQQSFAHVPDNADCAIYIQGDSMEPLIKNGSIVFYKKQCDVENGEIAIVEIDGDGVTCKKLIKDYENERIILRSINKKYDDRVLKCEEIRIIGKVVTPDKD
ncbi:XRE family transcriptional regulator [Enterococcus sp. DIV1444a]|uniref:XRE family transcriptional regulator n=1 Tax=Enterococcus sp. DIV1444a TaxID=2774679 RepID=UPI00372B1646